MGLNLRVQPTNPYLMRFKINQSSFGLKIYLGIFITIAVLLGLVMGTSSVFGTYVFKNMLQVRGLFFSLITGFFSCMGMYFVANVTILAVLP